MKKWALLIVSVLILGVLWVIHFSAQSPRSTISQVELSPISEDLISMDTGAELSSPFYLDVREDEEWQAGHVAGALHLKMWDILAGKYAEIPTDIPVHVYCRSGRRAGEVIKYLEAQGYTNLINAGGMSELADVEIISGI